jgi:hypothetical protein
MLQLPPLVLVQTTVAAREPQMLRVQSAAPSINLRSGVVFMTPEYGNPLFGVVSDLVVLLC